MFTQSEYVRVPASLEWNTRNADNNENADKLLLTRRKDSGEHVS